MRDWKVSHAVTLLGRNPCAELIAPVATLTHAKRHLGRGGQESVFSGCQSVGASGVAVESERLRIFIQWFWNC